MKRATKETLAGRRYLDLQREARRTGRPTDELIQLYALECFLNRLVHSEFADKFVLKGGVLLAALEARRPTRDIDFAAQALDNEVDEVLAVVRDVIREEDDYSGVRVTLNGQLSRATIRLHVDVNVGDPVWPEPQNISLPRLLDGKLLLRGYPWKWSLPRRL